MESPLTLGKPTQEELEARRAAERIGAPFLVYRDDEGTQHIFSLAERLDAITLGRRDEADISVPWDPEMSRLHAELELRAGEWMVTDDGLSQNGTWVNGLRLSGRRRLTDGDLLRVGRTIFAYCAPAEGLHSGYTFVMLLARKLEAAFVTGHYETLARFPGHWPTVSFSNHDVARTVSRFGGKHASPELAKMLFALLVTLKGTTLIYQGEELGLPQASLTRDQLRDPVGDLYWPYDGGRDGCRTPMPWTAGPQMGFTTGTPWLPLSAEHRGLSVAEQAADPDSMLVFSRAN